MDFTNDSQHGLPLRGNEKCQKSAGDRAYSVDDVANQNC